MKREFLQAFKIGDAELPKEVIDAIMAENGRDVEHAKGDLENITNQLNAAKESLSKLDGTDVEAIRKQVTDLQADLKAKEEEYQNNLAKIQFDHSLADAIREAKGKNAKAVTALLDVDTLRASKNQAADIKAALEALQKSDGYLFGDGSNDTPGNFSGDAGSGKSGADAEKPKVPSFF